MKATVLTEKGTLEYQFDGVIEINLEAGARENFTSEGKVDYMGNRRMTIKSDNGRTYEGKR